MQTENNEAQIRQVISHWTEAVRAKNLERVMAFYLPEVRLFDLAPPLEYRGADAYRRNWQDWFSTFQGPVGYEIRDLSITAGDDIAFTNSLNRITGKRTDGEDTDVWIRMTVGLRKTAGRWMVAHEHHSVPFEMEPPFKAALHLQPVRGGA